mgnify:CR=1 FL=1
MITLFSFFVGVCTWSLCEYILHRFVGHHKQLIHGFTKEHRSHHIDGEYFMPIFQKIRTSCSVLIPLVVISIIILGQPIGIGFSTGFAFFFGVYEYMHKRAHTHPPRNAYERWIYKHHFYHHFGAPNKNFGFTSSIWDVIFRTHTTTDIILIPSKKAMKWLLHPQTSQVREEFAHDYKIRIPRKKVQSG